MTEKIWTFEEFNDLTLDQKNGCFKFEGGEKHWYKNGDLHRLDGPAIDYGDGECAWYKDGHPHRLDGPAFEYNDGEKYWLVNGHFHRLDGPAIERIDGTKDWYIEDKQYAEEEFKIKAFAILNNLEKFL